MDRLATGVSVLDRRLDGGFPVGSVVVLSADPASQSELFVNTFASVHECLYLTTVRSASAVEDGLDRSSMDFEDVTVRSVGFGEGPRTGNRSTERPVAGDVTDGGSPPEDTAAGSNGFEMAGSERVPPELTDALDALSALPERSTLVIDSIGPLEAADQRTYRRFLEAVRSRVVETESVAVLHALKHDSPPSGRTLSKQVADVVFDLRTGTSGTEVINRLAVPKFRGEKALEETMKLKLSDTVSVDTSRDIA